MDTVGAHGATMAERKTQGPPGRGGPCGVLGQGLMDAAVLAPVFV